MLVGDSQLFFHVSAKRSCAATDADVFGQAICTALADVRQLFKDAAAVRK